MARSIAEGRSIPAHPDDVREGLREATQRRCQAERDRADAMLDLAAWVIAGAEAGVSKTEMAATTGLSRETIHQIIRAAPAG